MEEKNIASNFLDSLIVVIVLYETSLYESETFKSLIVSNLLGAKYHLLIYDNSFNSQKINSHGNFQYFHDNQNSGVSKAYNYAAKIGIGLNKKWLLLLDQDTSFPVDALLQYDMHINNFSTEKLFSPILKTSYGKIFSPSVYKYQRGFETDTITIGINSLKNLSPVNSGLCIDLSLFEDVGGYNERIPLDFSDFYFIEKVRQRIDSFIVMNIICKHIISNDVNDSAESSLSRFKYYCIGSIEMGRKKGLKGILFSYTNVFFRATILAIRYKTVSFYKMKFFNYETNCL